MEDLEAALGKRQLQNAQFSILKEIKAKDHHLRYAFCGLPKFSNWTTGLTCDGRTENGWAKYLYL